MGLSEERWYSALEGRGAQRTLATGQILFRQGDPVFGIFAVRSGRVRLVRHTSEGSQVVVHMARAGETFAEAALFSDIYHCDAIADRDSSIEVLPRESMLQLFAAEPMAATGFMARLARQIQHLRSRLELRNIRSAVERVRQYLVLAAGSGTTVRFDRPLKDVAAEIGLTHESFYRALATLAERGEITRETCLIILHNLP